METINTKEVLTFDEAANYAGFKKSYLYKLTSSGRIPHSKPQGGKIFFNRRELEKWLLSGPVKTSDQIEMESASRVMFNRKAPDNESV